MLDVPGCCPLHRIQVHSVMEEERQGPALTIGLDSMPWTIKYLDSKVYVGLHSGHLVIFCRNPGNLFKTSASSEAAAAHSGWWPVSCMTVKLHLLTCMDETLHRNYTM